MIHTIRILRNTKLFAGMTDEGISSMLKCLNGTERTFKKGTYIYRAGDIAPSAAIIIEGQVHIDNEDYWGNHSIIAEAGAGEILGEVYSLLEDEPMAVNAVAITEVRAVMVDVKKIFTSCESVCPYHFRLIKNFVSILAMKNRQLNGKMIHLSQRTTRDKLLSYLSEQSLKVGAGEFDIPFNRQQLADYLSVDRSAMSSELGRLRDKDVLEFHKNHFKLKQ